MNERFSGINP